MAMALGFCKKFRKKTFVRVRSKEVVQVENRVDDKFVAYGIQVDSTPVSGLKKPYPNKLHSPYDLTIVRKMKEEGIQASNEFILTLRGKIKLLREWGVPWKPEEMNRIFNHHGREWVMGFSNADLETTLLDLEQAYKPTKSEMGKLLAGNPQVLAMNVDETCYMVEEFMLRNLGFERAAMRRLIYSNPDILSLDIDFMKTTATFLRAEIGLHK